MYTLKRFNLLFMLVLSSTVSFSMLRGENSISVINGTNIDVTVTVAWGINNKRLRLINPPQSQEIVFGSKKQFSINNNNAVVSSIDAQFTKPHPGHIGKLKRFLSLDKATERLVYLKNPNNNRFIVQQKSDSSGLEIVPGTK